MSLKSTIIGGILSLSLAGPAVAQAVDGPSVIWKISMWGKV